MKHENKTMKRKLIISALFTLSICAVNGQKLLDKVNEKVSEKKTENTAKNSPAPASNVAPGANQFEMIEAFLANSGKLYMAKENGMSYMYAGEKLDYIIRDIKRNDKNQIIGFSTSIGVESEFKIEEGEWPRYFRGKNGGAMYFNSNYVIYAEENNLLTTAEDVENEKKVGLDGTVYGYDKGMIYAMNADKHVELLKNYLAEVNKGTQRIADNKKAEADKVEAEKRAKYTTKDRNVVSLSIRTTAEVIRHGESIDFFVTAKLKDGSEIATDKGGYIDEFEITANGLPLTYKDPQFLGTAVNTVQGNKLILPMTTVGTADQIELIIKSKFYGTVVAKKIIKMDYSKSIYLDHNGSSQSTACYMMVPGSLRMEIKQVSNTVTKEPVLEYKVFSGKTGDLMYHFRANPSTPVNVGMNGAKGWTGTPGESCSRAPKNGSDGGDVTMVIDPSVKSYMVNITNKGGASGGAYSSAGRDGKIEKLNQKVSW